MSYIDPPSARDRRRFYRAGILPLSALRVRIWKIPYGVSLKTRPMPSQELRIDARQLCIGGLTIALDTPEVTTRDRLRIEILYRDQVALVEGRLRAAPPGAEVAPESCQTGVVFHGRETDIAFRASRSCISKIVGYVQREELRHRRDNPDPAGNTSAAA
jgi:hypothetical protein